MANWGLIQYIIVNWGKIHVRDAMIKLSAVTEQISFRITWCYGIVTIPVPAWQQPDNGTVLVARPWNLCTSTVATGLVLHWAHPQPILFTLRYENAAHERL